MSDTLSKKDIGNRLRKLRNSQYLSVRVLCDELNITDTTYISYERGLHLVSVSTLIKISDYFNVTTDYILTGDE